jgi:hypothetical protein
VFGELGHAQPIIEIGTAAAARAAMPPRGWMMAEAHKKYIERQLAFVATQNFHLWLYRDGQILMTVSRRLSPPLVAIFKLA